MANLINAQRLKFTTEESFCGQIYSQYGFRTVSYDCKLFKWLATEGFCALWYERRDWRNIDWHTLNGPALLSVRH